jgi:hypothetical protein
MYRDTGLEARDTTGRDARATPPDTFVRQFRSSPQTALDRPSPKQYPARSCSKPRHKLTQTTSNSSIP